jgi:hypothetical protein
MSRTTIVLSSLAILATLLAGVLSGCRRAAELDAAAAAKGACAPQERASTGPTRHEEPVPEFDEATLANYRRLRAEIDAWRADLKHLENERSTKGETKGGSP